MALSNLHEVIGRALLDEGFRKSLFSNPKLACEAAGLSLQPHQYEQIASFDPETFESAVRELGVSGGTAG